ncbi:MAG: thiamine pyrophosphate-dependent enzyme [Actinomycetota bacterium]
MEKVTGNPTLLLRDGEHHLCPGCGEPVAYRALLETLDEMGLQDAICVMGIGCYTAFAPMIDIDVVQALHGRAPSVATGVKRMLPSATVFTVQGDGDMISEGLQEAIHAAARGEKITCFVFNNQVFGETGGHMTTATLEGQKTKTTPSGRDAAKHGHPIKVSELLATLDGSAYIARGAVNNPGAILRTKNMIRKALEAQRAGAGFTMVEILTMCPTFWFTSPSEGPEWLSNNAAVSFQPGEILSRI